MQAAAHHVFGIFLLLQEYLLCTLIDLISISRKLLDKPEAVKGGKLCIMSALEIWRIGIYCLVTHSSALSVLSTVAVIK